jgi:hypothetical protein
MIGKDEMSKKLLLGWVWYLKKKGKDMIWYEEVVIELRVHRSQGEEELPKNQWEMFALIISLYSLMSLCLFLSFLCFCLVVIVIYCYVGERKRSRLNIEYILIN